MQPQIAGLSSSKCICVMLVVIGCFAILWPKIFYPMFMFALNRGRNGPQFSFERTMDDQILPPKVREAMKMSPIRQFETVHKLPGRPQFYSGRRDGFTPMGGGTGGNEKGPNSNSMLNFMMPVYTIVIVMLFLYIMAKMSFKSEDGAKKTTDTDAIKSRLNRAMASSKIPVQVRNSTNDYRHYEDYSRQTTTTAKQRARDPNLARPSYKAFNYYGRSNVSKSLRALIQDMETFRTQLVKTEICHCKLKKYELARKATENCLNDMTEKTKEEDKTQSDLDQKSDIVPDQIIEETSKDNQELSNSNSNNNNESTTNKSFDAELAELEDSGTSDMDEEEEDDNNNNKENMIPGSDQNQESTSTMEPRKRKTKQEKKFEEEEVSKIDEDYEEETEESIQNKFDSAFDKNVLNKLNQELDRLMHLKKE